MAMARSRAGSKRIVATAAANADTKARKASKRSKSNAKRGMPASPAKESTTPHDQSSNVTSDSKHARTARPVAPVRGKRTSARISNVKAPSEPANTTPPPPAAAVNGKKRTAPTTTAKKTKTVKVKAPGRVASADPAKVPEANFIMSSSPRKPRQSLPGPAHEAPMIASSVKRRNSEAQANGALGLAVKRQRSNQSDASDGASGNEKTDGDRDVPPSPLKAILSPVMGLLRRVSGIAQDPLGSISGTSSRAPTPPPPASMSADNDDDNLDMEDTTVQPAVVGAPAGSPEAESLTAPPMNPTPSLNNGTANSSQQQQSQILYPMDTASSSQSTSPSQLTNSLAETHSKENIPLYSTGTALEPAVRGTSPAISTELPLALSTVHVTPPEDSVQQLADESNAHLDSLASLAYSEIDGQPGQQMGQFDEDEEDEILPYLFMSELPPVPKEHTLRPYALPRKTRSSPPITLVLDLDETLVHCALSKIDNADLVFPVEYNEMKYDVYCRLRPGYREFLERASKVFEVAIFTASQQVYADNLLNLIDPGRRLIRHRLFRDSCVYVNTNYVKDLGILGRDESKMLLVDNCPQAYAYQPSNGVPIESWYGDKTDRELLRLMDFLETLVDVDDVRPLIDAHFRTREKMVDAKRRYESWFAQNLMPRVPVGFANSPPSFASQPRQQQQQQQGHQ